MKRASMGAAAALGFLAMTACGRHDAGEQIAEEAVDSQELTMAEGALVTMSAEGTDTAISPEQAATSAAQKTSKRLQPEGCLTVTQTGLTVKYVMNDCTGPNGLVHTTGELTAVFSQAAGGVAVSVTGTGLKVNGAIIDVNATGTLVVNGTKRTLAVMTNGSGTGARGNQLERHGNYVATRDAATACSTLDGDWSLDVGARDRTTTITGLARCDGKCPAAGGSIVHKGFLGRVVTLTFDGSNVAKWSSSFGRSGTVSLRCGS